MKNFYNWLNITPKKYIFKKSSSKISTSYTLKITSHIITCSKNGHKGSVSILVRTDIPQHQININSEFQVFAVGTTLHKTVKIGSIYIPPHDPINDIKLNKFLKQIPKPCILLGYFNNHNIIWGTWKPKKGQRSRKSNQEQYTLYLEWQIPSIFQLDRHLFSYWYHSIWLFKLHGLHMEGP